MNKLPHIFTRIDWITTELIKHNPQLGQTSAFVSYEKHGWLQLLHKQAADLQWWALCVGPTPPSSLVEICSCWAPFLKALSGRTEVGSSCQVQLCCSYYFSEIAPENFSLSAPPISSVFQPSESSMIAFHVLSNKMCTYLLKLLNYSAIKVFRKKKKIIGLPSSRCTSWWLNPTTSCILLLVGLCLFAFN